MDSSQPTRPEALVFDVGGVLVDIDFRRATEAWSRISRLDSESLGKRFVFDAAYERHECGEMPSGEYFDYLASTLQLHATREEIEAGWKAIFVGEIKETLDLVAATARSIPCYGFSNTNPSHVAAWSEQCPTLEKVLPKIFVSHEIGARKPDPLSFQAVCEQIGVPAESVLFFDDTPANVAAAKAVGMRAILVRSPTDVVAALHSSGAYMLQSDNSSKPTPLRGAA